MGAALLSASVASMGAETGQIVVSTDLKSEPFIDSKTLVNLPASSTVDVLKRQGGWFRVKPAGHGDGWVKLFAVKLNGAGSDGKGESGMSSLWNVAMKGRSGNSEVTGAAGIRGLNPEDMKNAQPAPEQMQKLESFSATKSQAESASRQGKLNKQNIDYIAETGGVKK